MKFYKIVLITYGNCGLVPLTEQIGQQFGLNTNDFDQQHVQKCKLSTSIIFNKIITSIFISLNEKQVEEKKYWTKNNTLKLINEVKQNKQLFSSTAIRN